MGIPAWGRTGARAGPTPAGGWWRGGTVAGGTVVDGAGAATVGRLSGPFGLCGGPGIGAWSGKWRG